MKLLTVQDLSFWLRKSPSTIRSDASRQPRSLPPICRLPQTKRLLWREEDVSRWIASHVKASYSPLQRLDPDDSVSTQSFDAKRDRD